MKEKMKIMEVVGNDVVVQNEIDKPTPKPGEVLVKIIASAVNPAEEKVMKGEIAGRFLHAKSTPLVLGWDYAGTIESIGDGITDLNVGDAVWGHLAFTNTQKQGTYAEYITVPRNTCAVLPKNVQYHIAAAAPTIAMTSLQSMRDIGNLVEGKKILIIGAGGGIGSISIGIAKRLGGHVTGVCSTKDVERVKTLGANEIIDRKKDDPFKYKSSYDVIFDTPAVYSYAASAKSLRPKGTYVTTLPNFALMTGMLRTLFSSKRCKFVQVASKQKDLELVGKWLSEDLEVTIDSRYKIANLSDALKRQIDPGRIGRVVVDIVDGWE